jgi:hypothetical protein
LAGKIFFANEQGTQKNSQASNSISLKISANQKKVAVF